MTTVQEILRQTQALTPQERRELLKLLIDAFVEPGAQPAEGQRRSLRGLGKEIREGVDAREGARSGIGIRDGATRQYPSGACRPPQRTGRFD